MQLSFFWRIFTYRKMKADKKVATKHCSNYGKGRKRGMCDGVMFSRNEEGRLNFWVDEDFHKKACIADKCVYFKNIVLPGVSA